MSCHGPGGLSRQQGYAPIGSDEEPPITLAAGSPETRETPADECVEVVFYALIMVIMLGYYLPYRMQQEHDQSIRHQFHVQNVTSTLDTTNMQFVGDWNVTFRVTNRSNVTELVYQKFAVSVSYEERYVSISTLRAGFHQGIHKTTVVNVFPFVPRYGVVVGNYYGSVRQRWEAKRPLNVTVKLVGRVGESSGGDEIHQKRRRNYNICISCLVPLNYEPLGNNSVTLSGRGEKECDVDICHFPLYM